MTKVREQLQEFYQAVHATDPRERCSSAGGDAIASHIRQFMNTHVPSAAKTR
jgi:hypothetical protein